MTAQTRVTVTVSANGPSTPLTLGDLRSLVAAVPATADDGMPVSFTIAEVGSQRDPVQYVKAVGVTYEPPAAKPPRPTPTLRGAS